MSTKGNLGIYIMHNTYGDGERPLGKINEGGGGKIIK